MGRHNNRWNEEIFRIDAVDGFGSSWVDWRLLVDVTTSFKPSRITSYAPKSISIAAFLPTLQQ